MFKLYTEEGEEIDLIEELGFKGSYDAKQFVTYTTTFEEINYALPFFNNLKLLDRKTIEEIYSSKISSLIYKKWIDSDNNIIAFLNMLDVGKLQQLTKGYDFFKIYRVHNFFKTISGSFSQYKCEEVFKKKIKFDCNNVVSFYCGLNDDDKKKLIEYSNLTNKDVETMLLNKCED
jgi:hypothetical protein